MRRRSGCSSRPSSGPAALPKRDWANNAKRLSSILGPRQNRRTGTTSSGISLCVALAPGGGGRRRGRGGRQARLDLLEERGGAGPRLAEGAPRGLLVAQVEVGGAEDVVQHTVRGGVERQVGLQAVHD